MVNETCILSCSEQIATPVLLSSAVSCFFTKIGVVMTHLTLLSSVCAPSLLRLETKAYDGAPGQRSTDIGSEWHF